MQWYLLWRETRSWPLSGLLKNVQVEGCKQKSRWDGTGAEEEYNREDGTLYLLLDSRLSPCNIQYLRITPWHYIQLSILFEIYQGCMLRCIPDFLLSLYMSFLQEQPLRSKGKIPKVRFYFIHTVHPACFVPEITIVEQILVSSQNSTELLNCPRLRTAIAKIKLSMLRLPSS